VPWNRTGRPAPGNSVPVWVGFTTARSCRREAGESECRSIVQAELDVGEAIQPALLAGLGKSDRLAFEGLADEVRPPTPSDLAARTQLAHFMIGILPRLRQVRAPRSGRGPVDICQRHLIQRLMGPVLVEVQPKGVESDLLLAWGARRWARGLCLEGPMKAFVESVLLRLAGFDPLQLNPGIDLTDRQPDPVKGNVGGSSYPFNVATELSRRMIDPASH